MNANQPPQHRGFDQRYGNLHVGIIGGGTAGWMAAATLRRRLGCKVTLIESDGIAGVGVGEATIPAMVDWIENMGIDEDEFLRRTQGTYKLAIRFDDWVTASHRYWHPFGSGGGRIDGVDLIHHWRRGVSEGWLDAATAYADFSPQKAFCEALRGPRPIGGPSVVENYAFHLDAGRLAEFLRDIAVNDGVERRVGDVTGAMLSGDGSIEHVLVRDAQPLRADLYLDCSGFAGVLIEKVLQEPWIDWSDQLLCDRAVTVRLPRDETKMPPYTISTGLSAGWAWQIPLRETTGAGYVYSSRHVDDESARRELLSHVGSLDAGAATKQLSMRVGMRSRSWVRNCLSLGLASGFVEPLESTGIFLVQRALDELVNCLPGAEGPPQVDTFNERMQFAYEEVRDFVLLHYVLSRRDDTSFWRRARSIARPDSLATAMARYQCDGEVTLPNQETVFAAANHHFLYAGAGCFPTELPTADRTSTVASSLSSNASGLSPRRAACHHSAEQLLASLSSLHHYHQHCAQQLPTHACLIDAIHRPAAELTAA